MNTLQKTNENNIYNHSPDYYDLSKLNFSDNAFVDNQEGGGIKKIVKKIFKTRKNKGDGKTLKIKKDKKYSFKQFGDTKSSYNTFRISKTNIKDNIKQFINYILNYNVKEPVSPNSDILYIARNIYKYKSHYYNIYNSNISNRKYKLLPSAKYMRKIYDATKNIRAFFIKLYEYICINSIFENIIYNALYSNISNTFNVNNSDYVKYGLSIYDKDNVEEYVSEHNIIFKKIYGCEINLTPLKFKNKKGVTISTPIKSSTIETKINVKIPVNNKFYNQVMAVPGLDSKGKDLFSILGIKNPEAKLIEGETDNENDKLIDKGKQLSNGKNKLKNINKQTQYLKIINTKIIINKKILDKIDNFYKNKYDTIIW